MKTKNYPHTKREIREYERYKELIYALFDTTQVGQELEKLSVGMLSLYGNEFVEGVWIAVASTVWDEIRKNLNYEETEGTEEDE